MTDQRREAIVKTAEILAKPEDVSMFIGIIEVCAKDMDEARLAEFLANLLKNAEQMER